MAEATLLLVSGPPGAGKSTVVKRLVSDWDHALHLHTDDVFTWIARGYVAPWQPEAQHQNVVVTDAIVAAADRFADGGYAVVVDGVIGPWFLDPWRALDRPVHYAVLRPSLTATEARAAARDDHPLQDLAVVTQMHGAFADLGPLEHHVLDTTSWSVDDTVAELRRRLASGELALGR